MIKVSFIIRSYEARSHIKGILAYWKLSTTSPTRYGS